MIQRLRESRLGYLIKGAAYGAWLQAIISVLGARSMAALAAFICNVLVARQLGDSLFSTFYLLFSIMTIVAGLTGPAIDTSLVRFAAKHITPDDDASQPYFKAALFMKAVMLGLTALVCLLSAPMLLRLLFAGSAEPIHIGHIYLAFAGGAIVAIWGFAQSYFQSHQRFTHYAGYEFCSSLLRLGLVCGLIGWGLSHVVPYFAVYVLAPLAMAIFGWTHLPRNLFHTPLEWRIVRELATFGKWVFIATFFTTIVQRLDIILLNLDAFAIPRDILGRYSAAVSIVLAGELVLLTFVSVLLPKASALKSPDELRAFIGQFRIPSLFFSLALALSIPFAYWFVRIVLGEQYEGTEVYYGILILGVVVAIVCAPPVTALYSLGYSGVIAGFEGLRLLLTLGIGLWVIPEYGVWGMAVTTAGARISTNMAAYLTAHQMVKRAMLRHYDAPPSEPGP